MCIKNDIKMISIIMIRMFKMDIEKIVANRIILPNTRNTPKIYANTYSGLPVNLYII